ncbi:MAG: alpha-L-fucosidase [Planctomycetes bacterium]|nr:alpha-L-fucosidase [Planctomycetota bacterium]MBI3846374.1 alpha-L-fucosidase [Planctomycetota bacterium]
MRVAVAALVLSLCACASTPKSSTGSDDHRLDWWRDARFGMFIHWGLYAVPAGEWNGRTDHGEWIRTTAQIPVERYEQFRDQWNPVKFDADAWARTAKQAGMRYIVITTKHHDGFCNFDSKLTDWDVMSTPFHRDVMKELADACRREGIRICWYHSIMDWHHPDYLPRRDWEKDTRTAQGADFNRFVDYLHGQVRELLTKYGPIGVMWFDGEWESTWTHEQGVALYELCRKLQPDVIVNNRVDTGRNDMQGMTRDGEFVGDFGTPEQEIPATGAPGVDWETCMTMNDHWGYNAHDQNFKTTEDLVRKLVDIASKGGNFLLNVGPTAEGLIPATSIERLRDIGKWMDVNGDSIHGTTASPFESLPWGRCTVKCKDAFTTLYLHVFDWPASHELVLPGLGNLPVRARLLADPTHTLHFEREDAAVRIELPAAAPDPICSVVALEIQGKPIVYRAPKIEAASPKFVHDREVTLVTSTPDVEIRYTLDGSDPTIDSPRYGGRLRIDNTTTVKARAFVRGRPVSDVSTQFFDHVGPDPAVDVSGTQPGLACETYAGTWERLPEFDVFVAKSKETVATIALPAKPGERVGKRYTGLLDVPQDDVYEFALRSDDGSRLRIGDSIVVDNDGLHGGGEKRGTIALAQGRHPIVVEWFNCTGGAELELRCAPAGERLQPIAPDRLSHAPSN